MLRRLFIVLFYCLFGILVITVCLVLLFPKDRFLDWAAAFIERKNPGFTCSIGDIRYVHPYKLRFYEVTLSNELRQFELPVDTLLVSIEPRYPVDQIAVVGVLFGGDVEFDISLKKEDQIEFENLQISRIRVAEITTLERTLDRPVQGEFSFSGRALTARHNPGKVRFTGQAQIENFHSELRKPILNEKEVAFDSVTAEITFSRNVLDVSGGKATGPLLSGDFSGQIRKWSPLRQSRLEISGGLLVQPQLLSKHQDLIEPLEQLYQKYGRNWIPYRIEGTIQEPQFQFSPAD